MSSPRQLAYLQAIASGINRCDPLADCLSIEYCTARTMILRLRKKGLVTRDRNFKLTPDGESLVRIAEKVGL